MFSRFAFVLLASAGLVVFTEQAEWRWNGKVAVVTGASGSIGSITALTLADKGMMVIGLARRIERIEELAQRTKGKLCAYKCDITNEYEIMKAFRWIEQTFGGVDVLVNNAGLYIPGSLINGSTSDWRKTLDTNILAMGIVTKEALRSMLYRGGDGHIININSVSGHVVPESNYPVGMHYPSKFAVTGYSDALRIELNKLDSNIKVTSISPGQVKFVDILQNRYGGYDSSESEYTSLLPKDIAEAIVYALSTRPGIQVKELTIHATGSTTCFN